MKKNKLTGFSREGKLFQKLLLTMKLSAFLLFVTILQVTAEISYSQDAKVSLNAKSTRIYDLLNEIEKQTNYLFFYSPQEIDIDAPVTLEAKSQKVSEILSEIFDGSDISFKMVNNHIVLTKKEKLDRLTNSIDAGRIQTQKITGTVTDAATGEPVIGANVIIEGTTLGTVTDINGSFAIDVPSPNSVLVISFLGYISEKVTAGGQSAINVKLVQDITKLEEVVVVGYGTQKTRDIVGSVASLKTDELAALKTVSVNQALQGRASGVNVTTNSGMPGAPTKIRIRGTNSISSGNDPLWIIDGIPVYTGSGLERTLSSVSQDPLSSLNPNDIESIQVLKDAAATAIYGSRGSNGVIIITTKTGKGSKGKGNISVDYSAGISELTRKPEDIGFAGTSQWLQMADIALQNQSGNPNARFNPIDALGTSTVPFSTLTREQAEQNNFNWFDEALRQGSYQDINLSATKTLEQGSVFASVGYRNDKGVIKNNDLERITLRLNSDFAPVKNFSVGNKFSFAYTNNNRVKTGYSGRLGGGGGTVGAFEAANRNALPWMPVYDPNDATGYWSSRAGNIVANNDSRFLRDYVKQYRVIGGLHAQYNLPWVKGLSIRSEAGLDFIQNSSVEWRNALITENSKSFSADRATTRSNFNYNIYSTYDNTLGDIHSINLVVGTETMQMNQWTRDMEAQNLVGTFPEMGESPAEKITMSSKLTEEDYLRSYFGRANYKLKDRYIVGVSFRRDGSSKFGPGYRWGTFTAYSAGWILSEENFFKPLSAVINLVKIRGSYGQTGNNSIPKGLNVTNYRNIDNIRYGDVGDINVGTRIEVLGNNAITWETTANYDLGVDFGILNNRINGSFAYYYRDISDMLLKVDLPPSTGVGGNKIWSNVGDMTNKGFEFNISSINIQKGDFSWSTDFNITTNSNKIKTLTKELDKGGKGLDYNNTKAITGKRLGAYFMADYAGIDPEKGVEMIWEIDTRLYDETGNTVKTGRKIPATQANVDRHKYVFDEKSIIPTYFGGLSNTFSYKGLSLDVFFTFSGGNYIYDYNLKRASYVHNGQTVLLSEVTPGNCWSSANPNAKYPKQSWNSTYPGANWDWTLTDPEGNAGYWDNNPARSGNYNLEGYNHSRFLYKGDYIRLKNLMLSYNLPSAWITKAGFQGIRLYVQATNLWTLTDYPGYDPEGRELVDGTGIPNTKVFTVGASVKF
jgi:TonB-linked SusC/RagA family outer membrane protein